MSRRTSSGSRSRGLPNPPPPGKTRRTWSPFFNVTPLNFASETVPFEAIFIRAPGIIETRGNVVTLAKSRNKIPIAVREDNILGTSFHPELTDDLRIHEYFLTMAEDSHKKLENLKEN